MTLYPVREPDTISSVWGARGPFFKSIWCGHCKWFWYATDNDTPKGHKILKQSKIRIRAPQYVRQVDIVSCKP